MKIKLFEEHDYLNMYDCFEDVRYGIDYIRSKKENDIGFSFFCIPTYKCGQIVDAELSDDQGWLNYEFDIEDEDGDLETFYIDTQLVEVINE